VVRLIFIGLHLQHIKVESERDLVVTKHESSGLEKDLS